MILSTKTYKVKPSAEKPLTRAQVGLISEHYDECRRIAGVHAKRRPHDDVEAAFHDVMLVCARKFEASGGKSFPAYFARGLRFAMMSLSVKQRASRLADEPESRPDEAPEGDFLGRLSEKGRCLLVESLKGVSLRKATKALTDAAEQLRDGAYLEKVVYRLSVRLSALARTRKLCPLKYLSARDKGSTVADHARTLRVPFWEVVRCEMRLRRSGLTGGVTR